MCLELPGAGRCCSGILQLQPYPGRGRGTRSWHHAPVLDSAGRKISQLEEAIGNRLEKEGCALALAVADQMLMCFRSRYPSISLEPTV
jgi:hypothetical protein